MLCAVGPRRGGGGAAGHDLWGLLTHWHSWPREAEGSFLSPLETWPLEVDGSVLGRPEAEFLSLISTAGLKAMDGCPRAQVGLEFARGPGCSE